MTTFDGRGPEPMQILCYQMPTLTVVAFLQATETPNWATLGVGGILAGVMFFFYREDRKRSEEALKAIAQDWRKAADDFREIVKENAKSFSVLVAAIESLKTHSRNRD